MNINIILKTYKTLNIKRILTSFLFFVFLSISTQSVAQGHRTVKQGSDDNDKVEQVFDDVNTMEKLLVYYKIEDSKLKSNIENYQFWVSFLRENKISNKRRKMITEYLGTMKREIAQ